METKEKPARTGGQRDQLAVAVLLPPDIAKELDHSARACGLPTRSALIRALVAEYLAGPRRVTVTLEPKKKTAPQGTGRQQ